MIPTGGTSTLTFTVMNPNIRPLLDVSFTDVLPPGIAILPAAIPTLDCLGSITAGPGAISVKINSISGGATCTATVQVTSNTPGIFTNTTSVITTSITGPGGAATAVLTVGATEEFQVRYTANLNLGDSVINITNTGANGAPLLGPGFGGAAGNICVNVYAFSPDEQLISCCSCLITPNGLVSLSVVQDLISNTLTGIRPNSAVIKLLATATGVTRLGPDFTGTSCTGSAAIAGSAALPPAGGMAAWGTTLHAAGTGLQLTETPFTFGMLSPAKLASITGRCASIIGNGSGFGICKSCRQGALGAQRQ